MKINLQLFAGDVFMEDPETITDLTGTTWELNSNFNFADYTYFDINFNSNSNSYTRLAFNRNIRELYFGATTVWNERGWKDQEYRTISITGGTDATSASQKFNSLLSWLQANATQIYASTITLSHCTCNKSSETGLSGSYEATITAQSGYYLSAVTSTLGTVTIAQNKKSATVSIDGITQDFTISATGTAITEKEIILHPIVEGQPDYSTNLLPKSGSESLYMHEICLTIQYVRYYGCIITGDAAAYTAEQFRAYLTNTNHTASANKLNFISKAYFLEQTATCTQLQSCYLSGSTTITAAGNKYTLDFNAGILEYGIETVSGAASYVSDTVSKYR